jgi:phosphopantothenoylcysteine decarboxylase/phosphopantothenate--cysteine ligase
MARILITSGPTREYLDPVRYLTNGSSGRMGAAIATAALARGHQVVIISGPVAVEYPAATRVVSVISTEEMLRASLKEFPECDGVIAVAAPCDFAPRVRQQQKIAKHNQPLIMELCQTPDVIAELGRTKRSDQWSVAFALETDNGIAHARDKLVRKRCDLIVLNDLSAIDAEFVRVQFIDPTGGIQNIEGTKAEIASALFDRLEHLARLRDTRSSDPSQA